MNSFGLPAVFAAILLVTAAVLPATAQVHVPQPGTPLRAQLLDTIRPLVEAEVGRPVEFVVRDMRVLGEWAYVYAMPQRPGGGPIAYAYTKYQQANDAGMFDGDVTALLRYTPAGWLVYEFDYGATDVVWIGWLDLYPVPRALFSDN